ncbi:MAG: hypothetical protein RL438_1120 [Actinomycetota bacterium]
MSYKFTCSRIDIFNGIKIGSGVVVCWIPRTHNIIEFALRVNTSATTGVLDHRPPGDADLHAMVWGTCAFLLAYAVRAMVVRRALVLLFAWTVFVELAQPWFTQLRTRQATDLIGNCVGVLMVLVVAEIIARVRARR